MPLIDKLAHKLKKHPKRIIFTEGTDPRILQAARKIASEAVSVPILLGDRSVIKQYAQELDIKLDNIRIIDPNRSDEIDAMLKLLKSYKRFHSLSDEGAKKYVLNKNYFATLMLKSGQVDALVGGATTTASSALRPLIQLLPKQHNVDTISSLMLIDSDENDLSNNETLFMADCAVIPTPTTEQLADIAITTAALSYHLTDILPKVAMLSYSSKSESNSCPSIIKMRAATELAQQKSKACGIPMEIDGELQADAAIDASIAAAKGISGNVAGSANVLIFPDLNSSNIASKLVQILGGFRTFGQILTGFQKPAVEISRGASAHEIYGTAIIAASQAINHNLLYPTKAQEK